MGNYYPKIDNFLEQYAAVNMKKSYDQDFTS